MQTLRVDDSNVYFSWSPEWQAFHGQEDWNEDGTYHWLGPGLGKPKFQLLFRGTGVSLFGRTAEQILGNLDLTIIDVFSGRVVVANVIIPLNEQRFSNGTEPIFMADNLLNSEYIMYGTINDYSGPPGPIVYIDYAEIRNSDGRSSIPQKDHPSLSNTMILIDNDDVWIKYQSSWFFGEEVDGAPRNESHFKTRENWTTTPGASITLNVPCNGIWIVSSFGPEGADAEVILEGLVDSSASETDNKDQSRTSRPQLTDGGASSTQSAQTLEPSDSQFPSSFASTSRIENITIPATGENPSTPIPTSSPGSTRSLRAGSTSTIDLPGLDKIRYTTIVSSYSRVPIHNALLWSTENITVSDWTLTVRHAGQEGGRLSINYLLLDRGDRFFPFLEQMPGPDGWSIVAGASVAVTVILANLIILFLMRRNWGKQGITTTDAVEMKKIEDQR